MDRFLLLTFDGLSRGAVYATFALALVIIWRAARVVNFAQGAMAVAAGYAGYTTAQITDSYWLGLAAALGVGFGVGAVAERMVFRRVTAANPVNAVIVALGLVLVLQAGVGMLYGNEYRPVDTPFSRTAIEVGGHPTLSRYDLFVFAVVAVLVGGLWLLFNATPLGLRMRATAFAPEVSRLLGVRVARMLTLGWALAAVVGALAAMLIVPTELGLHPTAMDLVFVSAFTAAVVGGLDSPAGSVVGGIVVGLALSYASGYLGSDLAPIAALGLLVGVLLVRPQGLFTAARTRQV